MSIKKSIYSTKKHINIGDMIHTIEVQKRYEGQNVNQYNIQQIKFKTIFEVNCMWQNVKSGEFIYDGEQGNMVIKRVRNAVVYMPYREDIDTECYILYNNNLYKVIDLIDINQDRIWLEIGLARTGNDGLISSVT